MAVPACRELAGAAAGRMGLVVQAGCKPAASAGEFDPLPAHVMEELGLALLVAGFLILWMRPR